MVDRKKLACISTGDVVYRNEESIVLALRGGRKVLSTSVYNGGYHEDCHAVFNHDGTCGNTKPYELLADTYEKHMRIVAEHLGLEPDFATGMGTSAQMENAVIQALTYKDLTVTAIVTGGIDVNGGRAGDPADYYEPLEQPNRPGTINIILILDADMPPGTMARALVTCTEAKTVAIQELMAGSHYSAGLATGSGTDQTVIVANRESSLYLEGAGKHTKMGELIGKVVIGAVKEALDRQTGMNPTSQHDIMARLERFGVTEETLWTSYNRSRADDKSDEHQIFLQNLRILKTDKDIVVYGSLYIYLLDQYQWKLLDKDEVIQAGRYLLEGLAEVYGTKKTGILCNSNQGHIEKLARVIVDILCKRAGKAIVP